MYLKRALHITDILLQDAKKRTPRRGHQEEDAKKRTPRRGRHKTAMITRRIGRRGRDENDKKMRFLFLL